MKNPELKPVPTRFGFDRIELSGKDCKDFCQRLFTLDISKVLEDEGGLSCLLDATGKVKAIFWYLSLPQKAILICPKTCTKVLMEQLELYHFSEDCKFSVEKPLKAEWGIVSERGAQAKWMESEKAWECRWRSMRWVFSMSEDEQELEQADEFTKQRILSEIPWPELDIESSDLAFVFGLEEVCAEDKGCYIGQEVIERVRSRKGSPPVRLVAVEAEGTVAPEESILDGSSKKVVGKLTKSLWLDGKRSLALAKLGKNSNLDSIVTESSQLILRRPHEQKTAQEGQK